MYFKNTKKERKNTKNLDSDYVIVV